MSASRSNSEWLEALRAGGLEREEALADLREVILRGLPYALSRWLSPADPQFEALAEEAAQETLVRVLDNFETFEGRSKFTTWVHKIAVRVALTELRRKRWQDVSLEEMVEQGEGGRVLEILQDPGPDPGRVVEQDDMLQRVARILREELTENQRRAMVAVGINRTPTEEVARRMGTNRNALYKLLHDARIALKKRIEEEGLTAEEIMAAFER